jgi:hypothetical protein
MAFTLSCKLCQQPITFDKQHISEKTGKKIPLEVQTNQPHNCKNRPKLYRDCSKRCGKQIYFDPDTKTQTGKYIPLDKETGEPHQCSE